MLSLGPQKRAPMRSFGGEDRSSRRLRPGLPVPGQGLEGLLYFRISADRKRLHTTNCNTSADSLPHVLSYLIPADACPGNGASHLALEFNCKVTPVAIGCRTLDQRRDQTRTRTRLLLGVHRLASRNLRRSSPPAVRSQARRIGQWVWPGQVSVRGNAFRRSGGTFVAHKSEKRCPTGSASVNQPRTNWPIASLPNGFRSLF